MNENYEQPALPEGSEEGILRGMHRIAEADDASEGPNVQLLGSGTILREVLAAADLLREDFGVESDVWSVTSFTELRRDGLAVERENRLHPTADAKQAYVEQQLGDRGPVIAATDYMRAFADQIRPWVKGSYGVLGTDGFGRSDYRVALRKFFEIDRHHVAVAALYQLAQDGEIDAKVVADAIAKYDIDVDGAAPWLR
jgi:pyruvate dehydrogenase E1 component